MIRCVSESAGWHKVVHPYLAKPVAVRSRTSKNVKTIAIRISIPAATERHRVARVCPQDIENFNSKHRTYSYRKWTLTQGNEGNNLYAGSRWEGCISRLEIHRPIRSIQRFRNIN